MKKFLLFLAAVSASSLMALSELENLMIKEASTPEGKSAAKTYLLNVAKEKEAAAKHHEDRAGNSAGKAASEVAFKKSSLQIAKDLKAEAVEYKKAAEGIK